MVWPFRRKDAAPPPNQKSHGSAAMILGGGLLAPPKATFRRLASEGYGQNAVAFACTNLIATAASTVEPHLFLKSRGGDIVRVEEHDLLGLIGRPNPMQSWKEFLAHGVGYYMLSGNAYVYGNGAKGGGKPSELQLLSPGHVDVKPGTTGFFPAAYEYRPNADTVRRFDVDPLTGQSEVLHIKSFNPLSPWYGVAPMTAAAKAIDLHNASNNWNYSLLRQGARPSGALMVRGKDGQPQALTDEQFERLRREIDAQYSGAENAGRPLLLEGGLEWQEMSFSPKDVDFLDGKHAAAREIALAFGVPPQMIGIPGDNTYNNMESAKLALWTDAVLPTLVMFLEGFNRWLCPRYGEGLYLWYDEEMITALEPLRAQKADRIEKSSSMSLNEKRQAMAMGDWKGDGRGPGDVILVDGSKIPLDMAGDMGLSEPGSHLDMEDSNVAG